MLQTTDRRQTTDGQAIAYSEREREFTFANKTDNRPTRPIGRHIVLAISRLTVEYELNKFSTLPYVMASSDFNCR